MSKFGRRIKKAPDGYDYIEPTLTALDNELRERINEPHEGLRKAESQWPVHQINWHRSRYVYDLYYKYKRISKEVYDYCIENKIIDAGLIAKWKKPGYERLCSTYVINPRNYKFGTVSMCRVPKCNLAPGTQIEDPITGCRGCASGNGGDQNIFGNRYGQYLAAIQIARENRLEQLEQQNQKDEDDYQGPVGAADGSSGRKSSVWADDDDDDETTGQIEQGPLDSMLAVREAERDENDEDQASKKARR